MASATFAGCCMCSGWLVPSHTARWASGIGATSRSCARRIGDLADRLPAEMTVVGTAPSLPAAICFARAVPSRARCLAQRAFSVRNRGSVYPRARVVAPGSLRRRRGLAAPGQPTSVGRAGRGPRGTSRMEPSSSTSAAGSGGSGRATRGRPPGPASRSPAGAPPVLQGCARRAPPGQVHLGGCD